MYVELTNLEVPIIVEEYLGVCNEFFSTFFWYIKYIFSIVFIILGFFTLLRYRGLYRNQKIMELGKKKEKTTIKEKLGKSHVIVGFTYIFLGFGITFNFLIYILIWCLEPVPDQYLFYILDYLQVFESEDIIRIFDINKATNDLEKLIFYIIAVISMVAFMQVAISIWFITKDGTPLGNPIVTYITLLTGIVEGIIVGFTTCLPLFLQF